MDEKKTEEIKKPVKKEENIKKELPKKEIKTEDDHSAILIVKGIPVSTKSSVEVCNLLRFKSLQKAKNILLRVIEKKAAVPFKRYNRDVGHKPGNIAAGRYPVKVSQYLLKLLNSIEANADYKGLDSKNVKIIELKANLGSRPWHSGRKRRRKMKRTHIIIQVKELEK